MEEKYKPKIKLKSSLFFLSNAFFIGVSKRLETFEIWEYGAGAQRKYSAYLNLKSKVLNVCVCVSLEFYVLK